MKRRNIIRASGLLPFVVGNLASVESRADQSLPKPKTNLSGQPAQLENEFFYKPKGAWAADFIPFYAEGKFQLFYLLDWRDEANHGEGTPWYRLSTTDFVHFEEHGEVIPRGKKDEQDLFIFTGSAIRGRDNRYHIFYTGHNHHLGETGKPIQAVMHAVSDDLQHWEKIPGHTFFAPTDRYEKNDWRDPYVFYNEETREYNMLLAARNISGIPRRRGLTALCTSKDLVKWHVADPFYAPDEYFTHECPDLFKMGDWWYLVFSEFTDLVATRYRMSRSLQGPWITPKNDTFDGHAFYAAKTASDGKNRFIFGWNPTRSDNSDSGGWNWGGNLVVHQIHQEANGELTVRLPDTVRKAFTPMAGASQPTSKEIVIKSPRKFEYVAAGKMPYSCRISTVVEYDPETRYFGCMLRSSDNGEEGYFLRIETHKSRLVFDMWPRAVAETNQMVELERPLTLKPGSPVTIELLIDGNKGVVYVNNSIAMNFRAYKFPEGNWGFFVSDGTAKFRNIELATR